MAYKTPKTAEIGSVQVGAHKFGIDHIRAGKIGFLQFGLVEIAFGQRQIAQVHAA